MKTDFHKTASGLALKERLRVTRKWPIDPVVYFVLTRSLAGNPICKGRKSKAGKVVSEQRM